MLLLSEGQAGETSVTSKMNPLVKSRITGQESIWNSPLFFVTILLTHHISQRPNQQLTTALLRWVHVRADVHTSRCTVYTYVVLAAGTAATVYLVVKTVDYQTKRRAHYLYSQP
jgi:hypothetical protein